MRILLTGASGFVGAHLARHLAGQGHELFVWPSPRFRPARLAGIAHRIVKHAAEARAELVYHLASSALSPGVTAGEHEQATVHLTRRLVAELASGAAVPGRLVFTGSGAEYGSGHLWREEDAAWARPDTDFGRLKAAAAEVVRDTGIPLVHLRLFTPFGEGEPCARLLPSVARAAIEGRREFVLSSSGAQTRDYFHVSDLVAALDLAGRLRLDPGIAINICSGTARPVIESARSVARLAGGPGLAVVPGAAASPWLQCSSGHPGRAAALLGWRPRLSFDEGVARLLASLSPVISTEGSTLSCQPC